VIDVNGIEQTITAVTFVFEQFREHSFSFAVTELFEFETIEQINEAELAWAALQRQRSGISSPRPRPTRVPPDAHLESAAAVRNARTIWGRAREVMCRWRVRLVSSFARSSGVCWSAQRGLRSCRLRMFCGRGSCSTPRRGCMKLRSPLAWILRREDVRVVVELRRRSWWVDGQTVTGSAIW